MARELKSFGAEQINRLFAYFGEGKACSLAKIKTAWRIPVIKDLLLLLRLLVLKPPSQFMNRNPAYEKYDIGNYSYGFPEILDSGVAAKLKIVNFVRSGLGKDFTKRRTSDYQCNNFSL